MNHKDTKAQRNIPKTLVSPFVSSCLGGFLPCVLGG
jgi:hypothetical protein